MQVKLSKKIGRDSHVRTYQNNIHSDQSSNCFEIITGEVLINQPEPIYTQNAVSVSLTKGGQIQGVPLPGAFIDPITGNLHGNYEGPIPGQMVSIGFVGGNSASPIILSKHPYQGKGNTLVESGYKLPMFKSGFDATDVAMGHFSGSKIALYTGILSGQLPGSIGIDAATECNITATTNILLDSLVSAEVKASLVKITGSTQAEISAPLVKIDGTMTEINGNTKFFVTHAELNLALQTFVTALNAAFSAKLDGGGSPAALVLDISASQTTTVKTGG